MFRLYRLKASDLIARYNADTIQANRSIALHFEEACEEVESIVSAVIGRA